MKPIYRNAWGLIAAIGMGAVALAGCGTAPTDLTYRPPVSVSARTATTGSAAIQIGTVTDQRKNPSTRIGTVRGGYGNPFWYLESKTPVKDMVRQAFSDGLKARGMLAAGASGPFSLDIAIERLDSNKLMRQEAHTKFRLAVVEKATGKQVFARTFSDDRVEDGGLLDQVETLRKLLNDSLQAAVDQALDDTAFGASVDTRNVQAALPGNANSTSVEDRLTALQRLLERNMITKGEYQERRRAILEAL